jgi:hypothetical protein
MRKLFLLALIVVVGAAVLAPVMMMVGFAPQPGDFVLTLGGRPYSVPVLWSLCASGFLGLLYWFVKR